MANRYDDIDRRYERGREDYGWDRYERERDRPFREGGGDYRGEGHRDERFAGEGGYRAGEGFRGQGGYRGGGRESEYGREQTSSSRGWGGGQSGWDDGEHGGWGGSDRGFSGQGAFSAEGEYGHQRGWGSQGQFREQRGSGTQTQYDRGEYGRQRDDQRSRGFGSGFGGGMGNYTGGQSGSFGNYSGSAGMESYRGGQHTGRGPRGYRRSDERIREDINERLTQHPDVDATEIEVQVSNGEVTLTGTVDHRQMKRMAEDAAEGVSGVNEIHNQLRVKSRNEQSSSGVSSSAGSGSSQKTDRPKHS